MLRVLRRSVLFITVILVTFDVSTAARCAPHGSKAAVRLGEQRQVIRARALPEQHREQRPDQLQDNSIMPR